MSLYQSNCAAAEVDHQYVNVNIFNPFNYGIPANYLETRTQAILAKQSDWYLSVIRFSIPGDSIPIAYMYTNPYPNTDILQLEYSVTLTGNGATSGQYFLNWIGPLYNPTMSPLVPAFTAQTPNQSPTDPYYYLESYQLFITMINDALALAYASLTIAGGAGSTTEAPYMTYDPVTSLFSLWAQQSYYQNANPGNTTNILIWMNTSLYDFFSSFNTLFNGFSPVGPGQNFAIVVQPNYNNIPTAPSGYYQMTQEYSTLFEFNSLQSVLFQSANLSVNQESLSSVGMQNIGSTSGNQVAMITDFEPISNSSAGQFRQDLQYNPTAEYRLANLTSTSALTLIDIQVYWVDKKGFNHQLIIYPGDTLTIKIVFIKKSFYGKEVRYVKVLPN